jgi:hypothetical protein
VVTEDRQGADHGSVDGTVNLRREELVKISPVYQRMPHGVQPKEDDYTSLPVL